MNIIDWLKLSKNGFHQYHKSSYIPTWFPQVVSDENVCGSDQRSGDNELVSCEGEGSYSDIFEEVTCKAGNLSPPSIKGEPCSTEAITFKVPLDECGIDVVDSSSKLLIVESYSDDL